MKPCPTCNKRRFVLHSYECEVCEALGEVQIKGGPRDGEWVQCTSCHGNRYHVVEITCPLCGGKGEVR